MTHPLVATLLCAALTITTASPLAANNAPFCNDVKILLTQAQSNFSDTAQTGAYANTLPSLASAEKCNVVRSLGGSNAYHCAWGFPYRAAAATALFDEYNEQLPKCVGDDFTMVQDQSVNHPDFYDQRRYDLTHGAVSVSIKDKGALQKTYVFVAVHGVKPD